MDSAAPNAELSRLAAEARQLIMQRRPLDALIAALDGLPVADLEAQPWLLLALARTDLRRRSNFLRAAEQANLAERAFEQQNDRLGIAWTAVEWAMLGFYMHDPRPGLEAAQQALKIEAVPPYLAVALRSAGALCLLILDAFYEAEQWLNAAATELETESNEHLRQIGRVEINHHRALIALARGEVGTAANAALHAVSLLTPGQTDDLAPWCHYLVGLAAWRKGELARAAAALDTARELAETSRHTQLWCWILAAQGHLLRDQDELAAAREAYSLAESWGEESFGPVFLFIREGQLAEARWSCLTLLDLARHRGAPLMEADAHVLLALIALRAGRAIGGLEHIEQATRTYARHGQAYRLASARLYQAAVLYNLEDFAPADAALTEGLAILGRQEAYNCEWWIPDLIENLMFRAIQARIEPAYARRMLNRRFLNSLPPLAALGARSVRVHRGAELELAHQTQVSLLPASPPLLPDLDLAALSLPAEDVGGDFYGYYPLNHEAGRPRQRIGLAIGDIAGKGLAAALLSSGAAVALATASVDNPDPTPLLDRVQSALQIFTDRSHANIALCYVTLDRSAPDWILQSANAGAIPPLIRRAQGTVEWLPAYGLPLGSSRAAPSSTIRTELGSGDTLLLVSDGVVEAMNQQRELFGFERLEETLRVAPIEQGARAVVAHLLTAVQTHAGNAYQHDDMTFIVAIVPLR